MVNAIKIITVGLSHLTFFFPSFAISDLLPRLLLSCPPPPHPLKPMYVKPLSKSAEHPPPLLSLKFNVSLVSFGCTCSSQTDRQPHRQTHP